MDDVWVFGDSAGELRSAQLQLESCMRDLSLNMGFGKTNVLTGNDLTAAAFELEHGSVDAGIVSEPQDLEPLQQLLDKIVERPETAARTSIHFATTRIRELGDRDLAASLIPVATRMPQGADHVARLFRDVELWGDLTGWYIEYTRSPWARVEWAVAQLGTMFPSEGGAPSDAVAEFFASSLAGHHSLPLIALAAQRLATWRPGAARELLRDAAKNTGDPLERRVLALAALSAGEERILVERLLDQFPENAATLSMLRDTNFKSPPISGDYAG